MKTVKNDRSSYKTRAIIGGATTKGLEAPHQIKSSQHSRSEFCVDSSGYFLWEKAAKQGRQK